MALLTNGFASLNELKRHHTAHGADFGATDAQHYEALADGFLGGTPGTGVQQCIRSRGDTIRYDPKTEEFGVLDRASMIRTYYRPIPCITVPVASRAVMQRAGKCHKYANNLLYFKAECARW